MLERIDTQACLHVNIVGCRYRSDFGSNDAEVLGWIRSFASDAMASQIDSLLDGAGFTIKYAPYDWSVNAKKQVRSPLVENSLTELNDEV